MNFIFAYLLQSSVSIIVLYLIYWLFLKRDTFFTVNRFYLAGSILFSLIFPLFRWNISLNDTNSSYAILLDTVTITPDKVQAAVSTHLTVLKIIAIVYLTGASLFLIRFMLQVFQVLRLVSRYGASKGQGVRMVFIDRNYQPFSFFRIVFIPKTLKDAEILPQILEHEKVHVSQRHSFDLLLLETLTVIQWFNPVIWFYRRSLKSIHEYLADEGVIVKGFDKVNYQELLLGQSLGIQVNDLTNNFNHSLLKNRIIMMTKQRSGTFSGWKAAIALPVLLGLVLIFSAPVNSGQAKDETENASLINRSGSPAQVTPYSILTPGEDTLVKAGKKEPVYEMVKTMPEYVGGFGALSEYLVSNIKYPEDALKKGTTGTVYISFIIENDGKISNASVLKGVDPQLDAEALRVVAGMPAWKPGLNDEGKPVNVKFVLPIKFALKDESKSEEKK
jgi:TonB family protein